MTLFKAKNFLVFQVHVMSKLVSVESRLKFDIQGDVEAVASQSPKDLTRLIEQISGSLELSPEYERAKAAQDRATENATFNFTKRRGIAGEIKQFKEQKSEAERFEKLCAERVWLLVSLLSMDRTLNLSQLTQDDLIMQRLLWKLFHIEEKIEDNTRAIKTQNKELVGLREDQKEHDERLAKAREAQAKARSEVSKRERRIKKQEKALEAKVCAIFISSSSVSVLIPCSRVQQPSMVQLAAQIAHSQRKLKVANELAETIKKDEEKQAEKLDRLRKELESVQKAANVAQGAKTRAQTPTLS